ncbi:MAG: hypothetical protein DMF72_09370 [Acidobacteria bacterium]|nr:MAG: hypothetical protein DMF72_09370 [Acidobacteriota bacterium]
MHKKGIAMRALLFLMLAPILWLMLAPANHSYSQNPAERSIEKPIQHKEPVDMEDIQVRDDQGLKSVKPGSKFHGNEDWLKGLTLRLKNTSDKSIVYAEIRVYVPTSETEDKPVAFSLRYGVMPRPGSDNFGLNPSQPIAHGRSVTVTLSDDDYELGKNIVREKRGNVNFNHLEIRVGMIVFDDGTAWKNGYSLRRDPNDPERWVPVDEPNPNLALRRGYYGRKAASVRSTSSKATELASHKLNHGPRQ